MQRFYRAIDPEELVWLRHKVCGQGDIPGIKQITAWRIEHGERCKEETAKTYYVGLRQTKIPFKSLFELATDNKDYFGWGRVGDAAGRVGKDLFLKAFKATAVLTYSGPSALFASLVMAKTLPADGALLTMPVYLAMHISRDSLARIRAPLSYTVLKEPADQERKDQCVVFVPKALEEDDPKAKYKIAIIDDVLMTGRPLRLLKDFLIKTRGYKPDHIKVGCCVCHTMILARRDETTPAVYGYLTSIDAQSEKVRFPWGDAIFFPRPRQ